MLSSPPSAALRVGLRVVYGVRVCINIADTAAAVPLPPRCSLPRFPGPPSPLNRPWPLPSPPHSIAEAVDCDVGCSRGNQHSPLPLSLLRWRRRRHNLFFVPSPSAAALLPAPLAPRSLVRRRYLCRDSLAPRSLCTTPAPPFPSSPLLRPAAQRDASCLLSSSAASSFFALQIETRSYMEL